MFIDTHCHLNMLVKPTFDTVLQNEEIRQAASSAAEASAVGVTRIINVGTSLIESRNCVALADPVQGVYAAIGIHPNDCTEQWRDDVAALKELLDTTAPGLIVGIGECGLDRHYPGYDTVRQEAAFRAQIELALSYQLPLIVHTRDAGDGTLAIIADYQGSGLRGIIHCFSEDAAFAERAIALHFVLGIGGTVTYPKNQVLRDIVKATPLNNLVLETDTPFLPIQEMRGKKNHPQYIVAIAQYIATLKGVPVAEVGEQTTTTARALFKI